MQRIASSAGNNGEAPRGRVNGSSDNGDESTNGNGGQSSGVVRPKHTFRFVPRSWVWKYASKVVKDNANGVPREYVICRVENCGRETLFCGTASIANHLANEHSIIDEPPQNLEQEDMEEQVGARDRRTNVALLNFITSGYLPFAIVENRHFQKYFKFIVFMGLNVFYGFKICRVLHLIALILSLKLLYFKK
jgi:hypothetical protein